MCERADDEVLEARRPSRRELEQYFEDQVREDLGLRDLEYPAPRTQRRWEKWLTRLGRLINFVQRRRR